MNTNSEIMRLLIGITCIVLVTTSYGQTSLKGINLKAGEHKVGFRHYTIDDSTRTYRIHNEFNNRYIERPIPISIWYPAKIEDENSQQLTVLNYLEVLKEEEEWKNLPNYFLLDWFPYLWNTPQNKSHLSEKVNAFSNPAYLGENFPVVVYAPSYQASSIENFALFEYLASNGFVVISSPSRGTNTRWLEGGTTKDMETQSRDVEFLLKEIRNHKNIDSEKIALMGFSFGGLSNAITIMKNKNISAIVSLDGTERYNYPVLENSSYFNLDRFTIPYIHFAQKKIPKEVITSDKIPEELNYKFQLYDSLKYSTIYRYRFHDLTHSYFSSFGVLFTNRDKRQDKSDDEIMTSYNLLCHHTLQFLNATLKNDKKARDFIENKPVENGFSESLVSKQTKRAIEKDFTYKDFNDLALKQDYQNLIPLYEKTVTKHPNLQLQEGMLNMLGLRLSFDSKKAKQGVNVFLLALHLYPKSANLYDSLAEGYLFMGKKEKAIESFEKSLELNPQNQSAIDRLEQLRE
ncbi:prolyl oligopeptidase family serine peptidase [Flagellimonas oceanensis]|uniref:prolyl oligopeptidase family serine peptidase n=1 Tax=Flagellimonas oceanensis TaxID=2499163 RepID=UPI000F8CADEE|nr:prolyl oligopeptidase family serine peptidase [Allomuricauda oceanensis]